ncbi:hypothetical protein [Hoeflea poritis]|uniref:Uncharacterized protein n=1 Tax=Hoeflea poritis TaxID=2993659 RepID=A0ABT4VUF3_9HYPH|nr:hypothetical protein [Hoeflea poritis]MDA4848345.1 hypothetical protein [Hoeflea poritis]
MSDAVFSDGRLDDRAWLSWGSLGIAALALVSVITAHLVSPLFGTVAAVLFGLAIGMAMAPFAPFAVLALFLFQNLLIAIVSPQLEHGFALTAMRSSNFVMTVSAFSVFCASYMSAPGRYGGIDAVMKHTAFILLLVLIYFLFGYARFGDTAIIYLRNITTPLFVLVVALVASRAYDLRYTQAFALLTAVLLLFGYLEFAFGRAFWEAVNGDHYARLSSTSLRLYPLGPWVEAMQHTGYVTRDPFESARVYLFNFAFFEELGKMFRRPEGPNFHAISYAYAIGVLVLALLAKGRWIYLLASLPLLFLVGSKGATAFLILCAFGLFFARLSRSWTVFSGFVILLAAYAAVAAATAIAVQNYHALGLMAGLEAFARNPLGGGLGASGILSVRFIDIDWNTAQLLGRTDVVVESAVAVLMHQMGVFAFALIAFNLWLAARAWKIFRDGGELVAAAASFMLLTITVNGIFHEEALFAPLALGSVMLVAGLVIGRSAAFKARLSGNA